MQEAEDESKDSEQAAAAPTADDAEAEKAEAEEEQEEEEQEEEEEAAQEQEIEAPVDAVELVGGGIADGAESVATADLAAPMPNERVEIVGSTAAYDADTESDGEDAAAREPTNEFEEYEQRIRESRDKRRLVSGSSGAQDDVHANAQEVLQALQGANGLDEIEEALGQALHPAELVGGSSLGSKGGRHSSGRQSGGMLEKLRMVGRDEERRQNLLNPESHVVQGFYEDEPEDAQLRRRALRKKIKALSKMAPELADKLQRESVMTLTAQPKAQHVREARKARMRMRKAYVEDAPLDARGRKRRR